MGNSNKITEFSPKIYIGASIMWKNVLKFLALKPFKHHEVSFGDLRKNSTTRTKVEDTAPATLICATHQPSPPHDKKWSDLFLRESVCSEGTNFRSRASSQTIDNQVTHSFCFNGQLWPLHSCGLLPCGWRAYSQLSSSFPTCIKYQARGAGVRK